MLSRLLPVSCWAGGGGGSSHFEKAYRILKPPRPIHPNNLEMSRHKFYISSDPHPTAVETTHTPIIACTRVLNGRRHPAIDRRLLWDL